MIKQNLLKNGYSNMFEFLTYASVKPDILVFFLTHWLRFGPSFNELIIVRKLETPNHHGYLHMSVASKAKLSMKKTIGLNFFNIYVPWNYYL